MRAICVALLLLAPAVGGASDPVAAGTRALAGAAEPVAAAAPGTRASAGASDPVAAAAPGTIPTATPSSFSSRAEPSTVRLGQPFVYEVVIEDAAAIRYDLPRSPQLGTLQVRSVDLQRVERGDETTTTARLEVAIFDALGEAALPDLTFTALGPESVALLTVPGAPITVQGTAEGEELEGLRPPQEVRVFSALPLWIGGGLLAAVFAFLLGRRWLARWKASRPSAPVELGTPEERALAALDGLLAGGVQDGRQFYFDLSAIIRLFLEEMTSLDAREMTTTELVEALVSREVPGLSLAQLGAWLERGDLHRFARVPVAGGEAEADVARARDIIRSVADAARPPAEEAA